MSDDTRSNWRQACDALREKQQRATTVKEYSDDVFVVTEPKLRSTSLPVPDTDRTGVCACGFRCCTCV